MAENQLFHVLASSVVIYHEWGSLVAGTLKWSDMEVWDDRLLPYPIVTAWYTDFITVVY